MLTTKQILSLLISGATSAVVQTVLTTSDRPADSAPQAERLAAAAPVPAANAKHTSRTCYGGAETVNLDLEVSDDTYGVAYDSPALWVAKGSPCRDINVRSPRNLAGPAAGQQVCTMMKVMFDGNDIVGWVEICNGWDELARWVPEGKPFILRAAIRPVSVRVAS